MAHAVAHDPDGCWIAERNGAPVGAVMALAREDVGPMTPYLPNGPFL